MKGWVQEAQKGRLEQRNEPLCWRFTFDETDIFGVWRRRGMRYEDRINAELSNNSIFFFFTFIFFILVSLNLDSIDDDLNKKQKIRSSLITNQQRFWRGVRIWMIIYLYRTPTPPPFYFFLWFFLLFYFSLQRKDFEGLVRRCDSESNQNE